MNSTVSYTLKPDQVIIDLERCSSCRRGHHDTSAMHGLVLCVDCQRSLLDTLGRLTRTKDPGSWGYHINKDGSIKRTRKGLEDAVDSHTMLFLLAERANRRHCGR